MLGHKLHDPDEGVTAIGHVGIKSSLFLPKLPDSRPLLRAQFGQLLTLTAHLISDTNKGFGLLLLGRCPVFQDHFRHMGRNYAVDSHSLKFSPIKA